MSFLLFGLKRLVPLEKFSLTRVKGAKNRFSNQKNLKGLVQLINLSLVNFGYYSGSVSTWEGKKQVLFPSWGFYSQKTQQ